MFPATHAYTPSSSALTDVRECLYLHLYLLKKCTLPWPNDIREFLTFVRMYIWPYCGRRLIWQKMLLWGNLRWRRKSKGCPHLTPSGVKVECLMVMMRRGNKKDQSKSWLPGFSQLQLQISNNPPKISFQFIVAILLCSLIYFCFTPCKQHYLVFCISWVQSIHIFTSWQQRTII